MKACKHANIVEYIEHYLLGDSTCIVSEYMAGGDLEKHLKKHGYGLSFEVRLIFFIACSKAILGVKQKSPSNESVFFSIRSFFSSLYKYKYCNFLKRLRKLCSFKHRTGLYLIVFAPLFPTFSSLNVRNLHIMKLPKKSPDFLDF